MRLQGRISAICAYYGFCVLWNLWEAFLLEGCVSEIRTYYGLHSCFGARLGDTRLLPAIVLLCFSVKKQQIESGVESLGKLPSFPQKVAYFLGEIAPFSRRKS